MAQAAAPLDTLHDRATEPRGWRPVLVAVPEAAPSVEPRTPPEAAPVLAPATAPTWLPAPLSLSAVAHDLRGPLAALATSSEILLTDFDRLSRDDLRLRLAGVHRRALWLQEMMENMLCAVAIQEGRFTLRTCPVDLVELVMEIGGVVEPLLAQKRQQLMVNGKGAPRDPIIADGRRLGQVLLNLVLNASKFGGENMTIQVTVAQPCPGVVRCTVADRGPGLPDDHPERLFEPYQQGATLGQPAEGGVGLGLAIVRAVVAAHEGSVGARPRRGGGAEFWFELPAAPSLAREEDA